MKIAAAAQMREIDRRAIEEYGIPGVALMQSAGEALARACIEELGGSVAGKRIAIVCGPGNNGGDGFVAARHLLNARAKPDVFLVGSPDDLKGDAKAHFASLHTMGVRTESRALGWQIVSVAGREHIHETVLSRYNLIADCLFGTGFRGEASGVPAKLIDRMNRAAAFEAIPIVACDIPSGVNADTGEVEGPAVRATRTVTFALPKPGLLLYPGAEFAGRVTVADIGIPHAVYKDVDLRMELTTHDWMRRVLPPREQSRDANKGAFGTVLVIAGSAGMAGAATLTALSALRAGSGLVMLAVPESVLDTAAALAPETVLKALPETKERTHGGEGAVEAVLKLAEKADAIAIGPGIGGTSAVASFVQTIVRETAGKPVVVDADGLNALASADLETVKSRGDSPTVLTPHPGEMGRLLGTDTATVQKDRQDAARRCAEKYGAVSLLKGARTLIATPDGQMAFNRRGSAALATAGSGDVLTGVIAALLGQKLTAYDAARAGAYLHALSGEIAAEEMGAAGVIAGDVRDRLPLARKRLYEAEELDEL